MTIRHLSARASAPVLPCRCTSRSAPQCVWIEIEEAPRPHAGRRTARDCADCVRARAIAADAPCAPLPLTAARDTDSAGRSFWYSSTKPNLRRVIVSRIEKASFETNCLCVCILYCTIERIGWTAIASPVATACPRREAVLATFMQCSGPSSVTTGTRRSACSIDICARRVQYSKRRWRS
eukprot:IDg17691t1